MSDEVLREMCDKNYHQLLPLIAEKMQKEKEQKDKLNAVKARLIYGEESGVKIKSHEESHYSHPTPTLPNRSPKRRPVAGCPAMSKFDGSRDPKDSLKVFANRRKNEVGQCEHGYHMLNSTSQCRECQSLVWTNYQKHRIDSYEDLEQRLVKTIFTKKAHQGSVEIHHISKVETENLGRSFWKRYKTEVWTLRESGVAWNLRVYATEWEVVALSHGRRKASSSWKPFSRETKDFMKGSSKTNKDRILRKQIDEMIKARKLSQFIKELKQNDKPKASEKGEASGKDKPLTILMIQPWKDVAHGPRITQSFSPEMAMSFPPLRKEDGTEGPMIIEVEMGGHFVHRSSNVTAQDREELIIYIGLQQKKLLVRGLDADKRSSEISGRMLKWKFELEGYDIQYRPRTAIKGQILADFIVERPEEESPDELMAEPEVLPEPWTLFTDGSSCVDGSGAGLILTNPEGAEFTYAMRFRFEATNNEAEYEALIAGLRIAEQMGVKNLQANVDSRLVANQVNGSYIAKESGMVQYLNKVKTLAKSFKEFSIKQIPRSENKKADALSKIASTSFAHLNKQVLVEELKEKSINEKEILDVVEEEGNTWMTPICEYLTKEILPEDKKKARAVRRKAARYAMINGTLYKKSFLGPWLWCVGPLQANYVLREMHEGSCSMHSGPRFVVAKVIQIGYYWPTMHMDARNLIRECNDCQIHRPVPRNPQQNLTPITSPWPFYKWGIDIAGPFPEGPGKVKFLIVAIDYFTKWIEAKAVVTITGNQVKKFVWDNIVCRFGLPGEIISDNGKQFRDNPFKDWCEKLCIRQCFASVKHRKANCYRVERANRSLGEGIKARLDEKSKDWIEELPHVL
ncbi:reverse transcriptase domain-containing protein [Tanacetum coccineum]